MHNPTDVITFTRTMREIALEGFEDEVNDRQHDAWMNGNHEWESIWKTYAQRDNEALAFVPPGGILMISGGGATAAIEGDVGADAIILVTGGGATVTVGGSVGDRARIYVGGGGATLRVEGIVGEGAQVHVSGGAPVLSVREAHPHARFTLNGQRAYPRGAQ